jgi:6-pyruvoyl-tetrahydropterin synthase
MQPSIRSIAFIITLFTLSGCNKVINININDASPQLVIQGSITNASNISTVTISRTINYSLDNVFPAVSSATVKITDSTTGAVATLVETTAGTYQSAAIIGMPGHTYLLNVLVAGKTYTASSIMPNIVNLDSVTFQINSGFGQTLINPMPNFQDPATISNNYQFIQTINSKVTKKIFVFDDRLSDGKYIARQIFNDSAYIQLKDTVQLEMRCLDNNVYEYFKQLSGLDPTNGQPTSPANPNSNIIGGSLGYFSAHTSQKKQAIVR